MSNILYIDDDEVAIKAMSGLIRRCPQDLVHVNTGEEAWAKLMESIDYDLIIAELKLADSNTVGLLQKIRASYFLKKIPVLIYSKVQDKEVVKKILGVGVQNYLFKPYKERVTLKEVQRAGQINWRIEASTTNSKKFFRFVDEEPTSFLGSNKELAANMEYLHGKIITEKKADEKNIVNLLGDMVTLENLARKHSFETFADYLAEISGFVKEENWTSAYGLIDDYETAQVLQQYRIDLIMDEAGLNKEDTVYQAPEDIVIEDVDTRYTFEDTCTKLDQIQEFPVMESAAASFQMALDDEETNLEDIVEMVERDAGLAASVLRFANTSEIAPGATIDDIQQAIATLGLHRTKMLAISLKTVPEISSMFTAIRWEEFWMHQVGCAMLSEEIAKLLKLGTRPEVLYLAGLIQDMGKILLHEIDSTLYKQALRKAATGEGTLRELEREYFGCSYEYPGLIFAEASNLPPELQDAIKYQFEPDKAPNHRDTVGTLSLANHMCTKYEIGHNGDKHDPSINLLSDHPAWHTLSAFFPEGFSEGTFTRVMENRIKGLKVNLSGMAKEQAERHKQAMSKK